MICSMVGWDADGIVRLTVELFLRYDPATDRPIVVDFEETERAGTDLRELYCIRDRDGNDRLAGYGSWPEWLPPDKVHGRFRVDLRPGPRGGSPKVRALVHRQSGVRREREVIEAAIAERVRRAKERDELADLRDLVGGPDRPLPLDDEGRTRRR